MTTVSGWLELATTAAVVPATMPTAAASQKGSS
jgi:hypothetical protein